MSWKEILKGPEIPEEVLRHPMTNRGDQHLRESDYVALNNLNDIVRHDPSEFYFGRILRGLGARRGERYTWSGKYDTQEQFVILVSPKLESSTISRLRAEGYAVTPYYLTGKDIKEGNIRNVLYDAPFQLDLIRSSITEAGKTLRVTTKFTIYVIRNRKASIYGN
jgi:hypothetical protein